MINGPMQQAFVRFNRHESSAKNTNDGLISIDQVAEILDCHTMTVRRLIKAGELGDIVRMGRKFVRVKRSAVEAYISKHTEEIIK